MSRDTVVGVVDRDGLSRALARLHRAGFGGHLRVLDGQRSDVRGQLQNANLPVVLAPSAVEPETVLIIISALGRAAIAAAILTDVGAVDVYRVNRDGSVRQLEAAPPRAGVEQRMPSRESADRLAAELSPTLSTPSWLDDAAADPAASDAASP